MSELMIRVTGEDADVHAEDVDEASRALRQELTEIDDVVVVEVQAGAGPMALP